MEEKIFPKPAVAGRLKQDYIEARLHTDGGPSEARNQELQAELGKTKANPVYVIVDPNTGEVVSRKAGLLSEGKFIDFLKSGVE